MKGGITWTNIFKERAPKHFLQTLISYKSKQSYLNDFLCIEGKCVFPEYKYKNVMYNILECYIIDIDWPNISKIKRNYINTFIEKKGIWNDMPHIIKDRDLYSLLYMVCWLESLCINYDVNGLICTIYEILMSKEGDEEGHFTTTELILINIITLLPLFRHFATNDTNEEEMIDSLSSVIKTTNDRSILSKEVWAKRKIGGGLNKAYIHWYFQSLFFETSVMYIFERQMIYIENSIKNIYMFLNSTRRIILWLWDSSNIPAAFWRFKYGSMTSHLIRQFEYSFNRLFPPLPPLNKNIFNEGIILRARKRPPHSLFFSHHKTNSCGLEVYKSIDLFHFPHTYDNHNNNGKRKSNINTLDSGYSYIVPFIKNWWQKKDPIKGRRVKYILEDNIETKGENVIMLPWFYNYNSKKNQLRMERYFKSVYNQCIIAEDYISSPLIYFLTCMDENIIMYIFDHVIIPQIYLYHHTKSMLYMKTLEFVFSSFINQHNMGDVYLSLVPYCSTEHLTILPKRNTSLMPHFIKTHSRNIRIPDQIDYKNPFHLYYTLQCHCKMVLDPLLSHQVPFFFMTDNDKEAKDKSKSIVDDYKDTLMFYKKQLINIHQKYWRIGFSSLVTQDIRNGRPVICKSCISGNEGRNEDDKDTLVYNHDYHYPSFFKTFISNASLMDSVDIAGLDIKSIFITEKMDSKYIKMDINQGVYRILNNQNTFYILSVLIERLGERVHSDVCITQRLHKNHSSSISKMSKEREEDGYIIHECYLRTKDVRQVSVNKENIQTHMNIIFKKRAD